MAKKAHQPESAPREPDDIDRLQRTVKELASQVRALTLLLDEIRDELIYAVRNDRFNAIPDGSWRSIDPAPRATAELSSPPQPTPAETPSAPLTPPPSVSRPRPSSLFG